MLLARDERGAEVPKILDFGVSKQLGEVSVTRDGASIGTPAYMAPELFGGSKNADARTDVYAVAVTLYEMLSGGLPFSARTYEELIVHVATKSPAPLASVVPSIPPILAAAVERGLVRDPAGRWQAARDFAAALREIMPALGTLPSVGSAGGGTAQALVAFEATLDARSVDPTTLRTAPPPVVRSARQEPQSRAALMVAVAIIGGSLMLGGALVFVGWGLLHHPATASSAPVVLATVPSPAGSVAPVASIVSSAPTSIATVTPAPLASPPRAVRPTVGGGVKFKFPAQIVGSVRASAIDALAQRILPGAQRCRPEHGEPAVIAKTRLFVQAEGRDLDCPGRKRRGRCHRCRVPWSPFQGGRQPTNLLARWRRNRRGGDAARAALKSRASLHPCDLFRGLRFSSSAWSEAKG